MDASVISVLVGGVASIAFVLWYFFGPKERIAASVGSGGVQEVRVTVKGGYSPDVIVVKQGRPVRLDFYRDETASCSEQVVFGDFGIARDLPAFKTTSVEFTPEKAGEFTFTCGMHMMRGKLVVESGGAEVKRCERRLKKEAVGGPASVEKRSTLTLPHEVRTDGRPQAASPPGLS